MTPTPSPDPARYVSPVCRDGSHQACANFRGTCRCTCHAAAGEGTGRPGGWVRCKNGDEFWVASFTDMGEADEIRSGANVGPARRWLGSWSGPSLGDLVIVTRWADGITPAPPASPVPPTPTPCPYIVTGGEGTSYCSLAERSAMHAAAPPSTPADPRPTDPTGSEA